MIPAQDYQALYDAGIQAVFGPGTNLLDAAEQVLRLLGHNMPPGREAAWLVEFWAEPSPRTCSGVHRAS